MSRIKTVENRSRFRPDVWQSNFNSFRFVILFFVRFDLFKHFLFEEPITVGFSVPFIFNLCIVLIHTNSNMCISLMSHAEVFKWKNRKWLLCASRFWWILCVFSNVLSTMWVSLPLNFNSDRFETLSGTFWCSVVHLRHVEQLEVEFCSCQPTQKERKQPNWPCDSCFQSSSRWCLSGLL